MSFYIDFITHTPYDYPLGVFWCQILAGHLDHSKTLIVVFQLMYDINSEDLHRYDEEYGDYADDFVPDRQDRLSKKARKTSVPRQPKRGNQHISRALSRKVQFAEVVATITEEFVEYGDAGWEMIERSRDQVLEISQIIGEQLLQAVR